MLNYDKLPNENAADGMRAYFVDRILPGSFFTAVLANDLRGACESADGKNRHLLFEYVSWLYNEAPAGSWGSEANVKHWLAEVTA